LGGTPAPSTGASITRNAGATIFLPSENEWYKAAYFNPATNSYYQYPTSSNTVPTATSPTATPNSANYYPGGTSKLTDVGAYSGTTSPYGAFDVGGNAWQWVEGFRDGYPVLRGGAWALTSDVMLSSFRGASSPQVTDARFGFRMASVTSVPEPSAGLLAVIAFGLIWLTSCRKLTPNPPALDAQASVFSVQAAVKCGRERIVVASSTSSASGQ
jgi:hypothetical protein